MPCSPIIRIRSSPHISQKLVRIRYHSFQLDVASGVGLVPNINGRYPRINMQYSNDGGNTWSLEEWGDLGAVGLYKTRAIWRRLGYSRDRVFRIIITDPVKVVLLGAEVNVSAGEH